MTFFVQNRPKMALFGPKIGQNWSFLASKNRQKGSILGPKIGSRFYQNSYRLTDLQNRQFADLSAELATLSGFDFCFVFCWNWVTRALLLWNFSWRSSFSKTIVGVRYESTQLWLNFINQNKSFVNIEDYFYKKERPFLVFFCLRYSNSILIERKKRHKWFSILTCFRIWTLGQGLG